ncbi:MAG: hypothetical protein GF334_01825 [Candidatus Altiarchaeales archaeon]|nr:hypothetical protein [Candidatus Altiarchaeales archaeon]
MDLTLILEVLGVTLGVAALGVFFFFYFKNDKVKDSVNRVLNTVPVGSILSFAASKVKDKKGVFDVHDALVVAGRLSNHLKATISDPENVSFEDVEDDVFDFLSTELKRYRDAGVKGVPDISDEALRTNVRVVFEQVKRALSEDQS